MYRTKWTQADRLKYIGEWFERHRRDKSCLSCDGPPDAWAEFMAELLTMLGTPPPADAVARPVANQHEPTPRDTESSSSSSSNSGGEP